MDNEYLIAMAQRRAWADGLGRAGEHPYADVVLTSSGRIVVIWAQRRERVLVAYRLSGDNLTDATDAETRAARSLLIGNCRDGGEPPRAA